MLKFRPNDFVIAKGSEDDESSEEMIVISYVGNSRTVVVRTLLGEEFEVDEDAIELSEQ